MAERTVLFKVPGIHSPEKRGKRTPGLWFSFSLVVMRISLDLPTCEPLLCSEVSISGQVLSSDSFFINSFSYKQENTETHATWKDTFSRAFSRAFHCMHAAWEAAAQREKVKSHVECMFPNSA